MDNQTLIAIIATDTYNLLDTTQKQRKAAYYKTRKTMHGRSLLHQLSTPKEQLKRCLAVYF